MCGFLGWWAGWTHLCWELFSEWLILSLSPKICVLALQFCKLLCSGVIRQEWSLRYTGPHGQVRVQKQVGETGGEIRDKLVGDGAQSPLHLSRQLSVMVLLLKEGPTVNQYNSRYSFLLKSKAWEDIPTLFLIARSRSLTDPPL